MITWRDRLRACVRHCRRDPWGALFDLAVALGILFVIFLMALLSAGCAETKETHQEHRYTTETWKGSVTVPVPLTVNDKTTYVDTTIPVFLTRTIEENADGGSDSKTGFDPQAAAQIGGALAGALKQAFPLLGVLGSTSAPAPGGSGLDWWLGGGGVLATALTGYKAMTASRSATKLQAENDDVWEQHSAERARRAAAEAKLKALGHEPPALPDVAEST